jgi:hypothetical protein
MDNTNGVACAVLSPDSLACRFRPVNGIDMTDPKNRGHYGVHGFVIKPGGNWTF